jgi:outer membrane lipoprotein-sorting protein
MEIFRPIALLSAALACLLLSAGWAPPGAQEILDRMDANMRSKNRVVSSRMTIKGKRRERVIEARSWSEGADKSLTEYLSPAREAGTKMLKLEGRLWIYTPASDRTLQLSGHLLRQSVMGSDLSYEDLMEDRRLSDVYSPALLGADTLDGRQVWVLELTAQVPDVAYFRRKLWVDQERYVPLREELFAKSGQLLKQTAFGAVARQDGRWFPMRMLYKDMMQQGDGTLFEILSIRFDQALPADLFTKASLK